MSNNTLNFDRQHKIFDPINQKLKIHIVGVGSIGSFIALNLAKLGFNQIKITDFDIVEEHNIPNQFYRIRDIGKFKVNALQEIIKSFTNLEVEIENIKIDENYEWDLDLNSLIVVAVDSMEVRQMIFEQIKDIPVKILDTRMGGEMFNIYCCDLGNEEDKERYKKTLYIQTSDLMCGEKSIIYNVLNIASESCNIIKMIDKDEEYPRTLIRDMKGYVFFGGKKAK